MEDNVRDDKVTGNAGIPGTGISYRQQLDDPSADKSANKSGSGVGRVVWVLILLAVLGFIFGH